MSSPIVAPLELGLVCAGLAPLVRFYEAAFGFDVVGRVRVPGAVARRTPLSAEGYEVVRLQSPFGERLKLLCQESAPGHEVRPPGERILERRNGTFLTLLVSDLEEAVSRVVAAGGASASDPAVLRDGLSVAFARDPEGNWLELARYDDLPGYRGDGRHVAPRGADA